MMDIAIFLLNNTASYSKKSSVDKLYDVSVKSINCVCARTNKQFILIDTPNTENEIKWCEHAILWEFEVFEDCGNCIAMEQSGYISEWQNLLLTLTSYYYSINNHHPGGIFSYGNRTQIFNTKT